MSIDSIRTRFKGVLAAGFVISIWAVPNFAFANPLAFAESPIDLVADYQQKYAHLTSEEIDRLNREELETLNREEVPRELRNGRFGSISGTEAFAVAAWLRQHPVVSPKYLKDYDPESRLGFCFGRAMAVHLELLSRGLSKESIRKVFITPANHRDQFHVVTVARGQYGTWWTFDFEGRAMPLNEWLERMKTVAGPKMKVYVTEAAKFSGQAGRYARLHFADASGVDGFYGNYFLDLLQKFRETAGGTRRFDGTPKTCRHIFTRAE